MKVLLWLLDRPRGPATVALFLFVTVLSVGTMVVFGGIPGETAAENVTVEATDLTVRLNDEASYPDTENDSVQSCLAVGTPGDSISVLGDVTLEVPDGAVENRGRRPTVAVSLGHTDERTSKTVTETGRVTSDVFWLLDDDETLSVGDTVQLQVHVRAAGSTLANATRPITVGNGSRSYEC
jgi:hypothetical protein